VLSTHILSEVQATCDRVIIINDGTIVADGTPSELQQKFHGSESVSLELKATVSNAMTDIFPKIKALPGVESVEYKEADGDIHRLSVFSAKGVDIREALFRQAVSEKWVLLEMSRKATSLEEVFHKLTQA
jgi:ABC-2 type transport system ATP-binding protein